MCTVQEVELCRARLIEDLDRWNVVTVAKSKKDLPEDGLIEPPALRDDHVGQRKVKRRRIGAPVARRRRCTAHEPAFSEQFVRDRIDSRSIHPNILSAAAIKVSG